MKSGNDFFEDLNDSEVLIIFKLTELSCICSKPISIHFNYFNQAANGEFRSFLKDLFKKLLFRKSSFLFRNPLEEK